MGIGVIALAVASEVGLMLRRVEVGISETATGAPLEDNGTGTGDADEEDEGGGEGGDVSSNGAPERVPVSSSIVVHQCNFQASKKRKTSIILHFTKMTRLKHYADCCTWI